jgi:hypothetical protein
MHRKGQQGIFYTGEHIHMAAQKGFWRAFWDFLVLFSGISTASNLSRTQRRPVRRRGLFLFRNDGGNAKVIPGK